MSVITEIEALSYACEIDMSDTINVNTGKFYKHSKNKTVKAKILGFNSLKDPDIIGNKEMRFLGQFPEIRDHFFYSLDCDIVIEKFKKKNLALSKMKIRLLSKSQNNQILNFAIENMLLKNSYLDKNYIIPLMFDRGYFFNEEYDIEKFCKGKHNKIDTEVLRSICYEYEIRYNRPVTVELMKYCNMAIAVFIDEYLDNISIPEGVVMNEDVNNIINCLRKKLL